MSNKKSLFLAFAFASLMVAPMAHAAPGMTFGLTGGAAMPMGDFSDGFNTGFNGGVYGDWWINNQFAIGADVLYNQMSGKDEFETALGVDKITGTFIQFGGHVKWMFPMEGSSIAPWLQGGVAAYNGKVEVEGSGVSADDSSTDMGINVGAGLGFWSSPSMSVGVLGLFHNVMTEDESTQYINLGLNLTFSTTGTSSMGAK